MKKQLKIFGFTLLMLVATILIVVGILGLIYWIDRSGYGKIAWAIFSLSLLIFLLYNLAKTLVEP